MSRALWFSENGTFMAWWLDFLAGCQDTALWFASHCARIIFSAYRSVACMQVQVARAVGYTFCLASCKPWNSAGEEPAKDGTIFGFRGHSLSSGLQEHFIPRHWLEPYGVVNDESHVYPYAPFPASTIAEISSGTERWTMRWCVLKNSAAAPAEKIKALRQRRPQNAHRGFPSQQACPAHEELSLRDSTQRMAKRVTAAPSSSFSFCRMFMRCTSTVLGLMRSAAAISCVPRPSPII